MRRRDVLATLGIVTSVGMSADAAALPSGPNLGSASELQSRTQNESGLPMSLDTSCPAAYNVVTITGIADGAAWENLARPRPNKRPGGVDA